ncbi:MAG: hypothetical protein U0531_16450 [Dehalococcoidia bacterium]
MTLHKDWIAFGPEHERMLPGNLGVYEIGDAEGKVLYIGYAGGRSLFGLRGVIPPHFASAQENAVLRDHARVYRYEVNQMYLTRWIELLTRHRDLHGSLPAGNLASGQELPRLGSFKGTVA